jgi:hypothetical protein
MRDLRILWKLTVRDGECKMRTHVIVGAVVLTAAAALSAAGPETKFKVPRTAEGQPDLHGVWNFSSGAPLQRPAAFAGKKFFTKEEFDKQRATTRNGLAAIARFAPVEAVSVDWIDTDIHVDDLRTSLITYPENGRLPSLVEGVSRLPGVEDILSALSDPKSADPRLFTQLAALGAGKKDSYTDLGPSERCLLGPVVPIMPGLGDNYVQIIQSRDQVALRTDEFVRIIALDGKPPVGERLRSWAGVSRGHWEGETLVIETRNFNDRALSFAGAGRAREKVVTERFTRTSQNGIEYAATVVDPKTFQDKVEVSFPMVRVDARIYESTCHEGNYSLPNALSAARAGEREAPEAMKREAIKDVAK